MLREGIWGGASARNGAVWADDAACHGEITFCIGALSEGIWGGA